MLSMNPNPVLVLPARLKSLASLAALLEKLEHTPREASAEQYRQVAQGVLHELASTPMDDSLDQLLGLFPATETLYENQRYGLAGLCRTPLDLSLNTEQLTRQCLQGFQRQTPH